MLVGNYNFGKLTYRYFAMHFDRMGVSDRYIRTQADHVIHKRTH
jgi:hypothetical protein